MPPDADNPGPRDHLLSRRRFVAMLVAGGAAMVGGGLYAAGRRVAAQQPSKPRRLFVPGVTHDTSWAPAPQQHASCTDLLSRVNKQLSLAPDCVPPDLVALPDRVAVLFDDPVLFMRRDAANALVEMLDAAREQGREIYARSAYRDYAHQAALFQYWVDLIGLQRAERTSARAGYSEHQLGTAADLCSPENGYVLDGFDLTSGGQWLAENHWRFGFVISYPPGKELITGYDFEPWHVRFVGREAASLVRSSGLTLHEFLGL